MSNELITLIANIALALTFFAGLIFGIFQVRADARNRRERLTVQTLQNFQTREFAELIHYITSKELPANINELHARPENEQVIFIQLGQLMESLGILVAEGLINLDLVDKTIGSLVTTAWDKYEAMFLDTRLNQPDPFLGEYFQWLAERIDERMKKNPRKPFYQT
jgi:hypothetical protein